MPRVPGAKNSGLLGGGRARLALTYFRMNNSQSYDYNEVASFEFPNCMK